jgi:hypothetical protein
MSEPVGDPNLLVKLLDWGWAGVLGLVAFVHRAQNEKIESASAALRERATNVDARISAQELAVAKLFDRLEEHGRRSEDRHHELLNALHAGLDRKADK